MRNKIKEIMNKEEGFTLVELLAVIVILGIIVAIAIPAVGSVINRADSDANEAEQDLIVDAGRLYFTTFEPDNDEEGLYVDVETLKTHGYLEERSGEEVQPGYVFRERGEQIPNTDNYNYTYTFSETEGTTESDPAVGE